MQLYELILVARSCAICDDSQIETRAKGRLVDLCIIANDFHLIKLILV